MNRMARLAAVFCAGLGLLAVGEAAPFKTDHVTAELVAEHSAVHPGQALRVGLKIRHHAQLVARKLHQPPLPQLQPDAPARIFGG